MKRSEAKAGEGKSWERRKLRIEEWEMGGKGKGEGKERGKEMKEETLGKEVPWRARKSRENFEINSAISKKQVGHHLRS